MGLQGSPIVRSVALPFTGPIPILSMVRLPAPFGALTIRPMAGVILLTTLLAPGAALARPSAVVKEILDGKEMFIEARPASVNQKAQAPRW